MQQCDFVCVCVLEMVCVSISTQREIYIQIDGYFYMTHSYIAVP